jgi:hypothetical protein
MDTNNINKNNEWDKVLKSGKIKFDSESDTPERKIYKSYQVSNKQRRGVNINRGR